ncbi:MAG TPA: hypothetical protein VGL93_14700 [Streptosporangiaceae bacterium]|jgi:hypothetical protein
MGLLAVSRTRAAAAGAAALLASGCGAPGRSCPGIVARSGVQVDATKFAGAHPDARRWCVNGVCAAVRRGPAVRLVPPGGGTGPVTVRVTVTGRGGARLLAVTRTVALRHPDVGDCPGGRALTGHLTVRADGSTATS